MKSILKKTILFATTAAVGTSVGAVSESFPSRRQAVVSSYQGDMLTNEFGGYDLVTADRISYQEPSIAGITDLEYDDMEYDDYDFEDEEYEYGFDSDEEEFPHDYYIYTNDEFYTNLVEAREKYAKLLKNGSLSSQMMSRGNDLSEDERAYVDYYISFIYETISNYISCYDNNDFMSCYYYGKSLMDCYYSGLGYDAVYYLLIAKNLPSKYQSFIQYQDSYGAYHLNNGEVMRLIGTDSDSLLSWQDNMTDEYDDAIHKTEWFKKLPSLMLNHYSTITNSVSNDDICYFWNETVVDKTCTKEWKNLKEQDSEYYGFNPDNIRVVWSNDYDSYVYVDSDSNVYGILSSDSNRRVSNILMVQDALSTGYGNVYDLDSAVRDMNTSQKNKTYTR